MKIKSFKNINGWRWIGFLLAMISVSILSNANISTQWVGWSFSVIACVMWIYFGLKDKDWPRALIMLNGALATLLFTGILKETFACSNCMIPL